MATAAAPTRAEVNDILISAVERRPPLWDVRHKEYKNTDRKQQLWEEVAAEAGIEVQAAKDRWKSLRDTFRRHLKNGKNGGKSGAGAGDAPTVKWKFFRQMLFVSDTVEIGSTSGNLPLREERSPCATDIFEEMYAEAMPEGEDDIGSFNSDGGTNDLDKVLQAEEVPRAASQRPATTARVPKRKKMTPSGKALEEVNLLLRASPDEADKFGSLLAEYVRRCPRELRGKLEVGLLSFADSFILEALAEKE